MKTIQITATVDVSNVEQMQALSEFLDALSRTDDGTSAPAPVTTTTKTPAPVVAPAATGEKIDAEDLRKIVKEKSANVALRPKVKAVLEKYKASNVSGVAEADYPAFKKDLEAIK